ncbi:MAG: hypothetical protein CVV30_11315 [Methanomicrobiales archaeon HGW-Methanomicrobiales-1]|nr:MAG: hypothetical protein CVV30_11315 [Methanomicrobiales archaeon HGW-Methanomicrobiales-1]
MKGSYQASGVFSGRNPACQDSVFRRNPGGIRTIPYLGNIDINIFNTVDYFRPAVNGMDTV